MARRRPRPVHVAPFRARVVRGPHKADPAKWYWRAERYDGTKDRTVWTGWSTRSEVVELLRKIDTRTPTASPTARTVAELVQAWLGQHEERADLSARTIDTNRAAVRRIIGRDLLPAKSAKRMRSSGIGIGRVRLDQVTRATLERWQNQRIGAGDASGTVRLDMERLRQAWTWGRELGLVRFEIPRVTVKVTRTYDNHTPSRADVEATLDECRPHVRTALLVLYSTGCRRGEALGLTWDRIDLEGRQLTVIGKTGERRLHMPEPLAVHLDETPPDERTGRIVPVAFVYSQIRTAAQRAGVRPFNPGGLRRLAVDIVYENNDPYVAAAWFGHSPEIAMKHYRASVARRAHAKIAASLGPGRADNVIPFKAGEGE